MDSFTITFLILLVLALFVLRWIISPIPLSVPDEFNIPDPARQPPSMRPISRQHREITESMIEVVQAIGPQLSVSQIKYSLEQTGSVEATIDMLMDQGNLPYPPSETPSAIVSEDHVTNKEPKSLLEKYKVDCNDIGVVAAEGSWGKDEDERVSLLRKRKADMILRARRNMEKHASESE